MSAHDRLQNILVKQNRAEKNIRDLKDIINLILQINPSIIGRKINVKASEVTFYVDRPWTIPPEFNAIVGDVLHNIRSSLDHLVWQLIEAAGNKPGRNNAFPIFDTPEMYEAKSPGKVKGMRDDPRNLIDSIKPYKGGNDVLWVLDELDVIDKHRLLLTVGTASYARSLTPSESTEGFKSVGPLSGFFMELGRSGIIVAPTNPTSLMEAGAELLTVPMAEAHDDMQFLIDIALYEPRIIESPVPVMPLLEGIRAFVNETIFRFAAFLS